MHLSNWAVHATILGTRLEVSRCAERKVKKYASHSNFSSPDRSGHSALVGESIYSNGRQHQVDLECSRGDRGGVVAAQCIWIVPLSLAYPCRNVTEIE
jgi:hypothetical protein